MSKENQKPNWIYFAVIFIVAGLIGYYAKALAKSSNFVTGFDDNKVKTVQEDTKYNLSELEERVRKQQEEQLKKAQEAQQNQQNIPSQNAANDGGSCGQ